MIHEILASDVEFAQGMINSSHSDPEILAYLTSRGIESARAAELLDDLHHGRKPNIKVPFVPGAGSAPAGSPAPTRRAETPQQNHQALRKHVHKGKHKRHGMPWWFVLMVVIFILALGYAFLEMGANESDAIVNKVKHEIPPAPGK
jgi:hypothetical protein